MVVESLSPEEQAVLAAVCRRVVRESPLFRPTMPALGTPFRIQMTCVGRTGWVSDFEGYRYTGLHPVTNAPWPELPAEFLEIAQRHGLEDPDTCLINVFDEPKARLGLHQDLQEQDRKSPIVTVSLGASAVLLLGTQKRADPPQRITIKSGDVYTLAGDQRLAYHGIDGILPWTGPEGLLKDPSTRISLTMRSVWG